MSLTLFLTSQVRCSGPGLERARVGEKGEFFVDCTNAGPADLTIEIISDSGTEAEVHIQDNGDGTYTITYIPLYPGSYTLTIRYGGQDVPNFPARLNVEPAVDASGVRVFGPGVESKGRITLEAAVNPAGYCGCQGSPSLWSHLRVQRPVSQLPPGAEAFKQPLCDSVQACHGAVGQKETAVISAPCLSFTCLR